MKEQLVATGNLQACDAVAKQLSRKSVTDTTKEKPVTKQMLKEMWHWDETLVCTLFAPSCSICTRRVSALFFSHVPLSLHHALDFSSKYNDREHVEMGSSERKGLQTPNQPSRVHRH